MRTSARLTELRGHGLARRRVLLFQGTYHTGARASRQTRFAIVGRRPRRCQPPETSRGPPRACAAHSRPASLARGALLPPARKRTTPSNPLRPVVRSRRPRRRDDVRRPCLRLALDLDALRSTLAENSKDILRMSDPERFLNPAEIDSSELSPPETP